MRLGALNPLLLGALLLVAGAAPQPMMANTSASCSYPSFTPVPASDCSFDTTEDVAAGGTLFLTVHSATPPAPAITDASSADGSCMGVFASAPSLSSPSFTLACPMGLAAGTPLSLTLGLRDHGPFTATLIVTYNANGGEPATDTIMLASSLPAPATITYPAGWNLVGGPAGTILTGVSGPLYTYQAGNTAYEAQPAGTPLQAGAGYWAYFPAATSVTLPSVIPEDLTVPLPAGQWIMAGNPFDLPTGLSAGAGPSLAIENYDPGSGGYTSVQPVPCCEIGPGEGAWVFSSRGGSLTISLGAGPP